MKILIVEDDTMLRNWLSMLLSSLSDYQLQIYEAGDGLEALEVCQTTPVELVITDIKMPRMDGLQLIQKLKESDPEIRTAVLSSYDDFSFVKVALQYGALDYILKAEMTVKDLSQLLDKVQNDFQVEHSLAKGIFPDFRTISGAQKAVTDFLAGQLSQDALQERLDLPANAPATAILFLHLQDKADGDVPIFEAADICTKTLFSENLHGMAWPSPTGRRTVCCSTAALTLSRSFSRWRPSSSSVLLKIIFKSIWTFPSDFTSISSAARRRTCGGVWMRWERPAAAINITGPM